MCCALCIPLCLSASGISHVILGPILCFTLLTLTWPEFVKDFFKKIPSLQKLDRCWYPIL